MSALFFARYASRLKPLCAALAQMREQKRGFLRLRGLNSFPQHSHLASFFWVAAIWHSFEQYLSAAIARTPPGYFFTAVCTASITCSSVGIVIISPFILFVFRPILEGMELVHLLITRRGPVWRVRILSGGTIRWKCYRAEDYPTPEAVARRCAEGLVSGHENDKHDEPHGNGEEKVIQHGSPLRVRWECWGWMEATDQA